MKHLQRHRRCNRDIATEKLWQKQVAEDSDKSTKIIDNPETMKKNKAITNSQTM
jgi:hypothetical protein